MSVDSFLFDDLAPHVEPVRIFGKTYALREASGDAVCKWRNHLAASTRMTDGKVSSLANPADAEPLLVAACLFSLADQAVPGGLPVLDRDGTVVGHLRLDANSNPDPRFAVPLGVVRSWPARYLTPLYQHILRASGLAEPEGDEELQKRIKEDFRKLTRQGRLNTRLALNDVSTELKDWEGNGASAAGPMEPQMPPAEERAKNSPNATTAGSA